MNKNFGARSKRVFRPVDFVGVDVIHPSKQDRTKSYLHPNCAMIWSGRI